MIHPTLKQQLQAVTRCTPLPAPSSEQGEQDKPSTQPLRLQIFWPQPPHHLLPAWTGRCLCGFQAECCCSVAEDCAAGKLAVVLGKTGQDQHLPGQGCYWRVWDRNWIQRWDLE